MKLVQRTKYAMPKASNEQRRAVVAGAGFVLYERGPYYFHIDYPGFVFTLAAASQVATAGMPAYAEGLVVPRDSR